MDGFLIGAGLEAAWLALILEKAPIPKGTNNSASSPTNKPAKTGQGTVCESSGSTPPGLYCTTVLFVVTPLDLARLILKVRLAPSRSVEGEV